MDVAFHITTCISQGSSEKQYDVCKYAQRFIMGIGSHSNGDQEVPRRAVCQLENQAVCCDSVCIIRPEKQGNGWCNSKSREGFGKVIDVLATVLPPLCSAWAFMRLGDIHASFYLGH